MEASRQGQLLKADYFENVSGLNLEDSPFRVSDGAATGGYNWDYTLTGGFRRRKGHTKINSVADTQTKSLCLTEMLSSAGVRTYLRASGRKVQAVDLSAPSFTNLSLDASGAATDILANGTTQPVVGSQFNTTTNTFKWLAGGGLTNLYAPYNSTKITANGAVPPAGAFTATRAGAGGGTFIATGTYWYSIAYRKASTLAMSNVALDVSATISATTDKVALNFSGLTGLDTTLYDQIWVYRSAVAGVTGFTTGDIVAKLASSTASWDDTGGVISSAQNVPRSGNTILDNSVLPSGAMSCVTTWKRRLVTAVGSTLYISDTNKPESWPQTNIVVLPSGGQITALSIISFTTPTSSTIDEMLVIQKDNELWVLTGTAYTDWSLKYISNHGAPNQAVVVNANGYLAWFNLKGIFIWDGTGKPIRVSRPVNTLFKTDGDLDKTKFNIAWGAFYEKNQTVVWYLSSIIKGEQQYSLKLDMRLTVPQLSGGTGQREIDGVFMQDYTAFGVYAGGTVLSSANEELLLLGDSSGFIYKGFDFLNDDAAGVDFSYETKYLDFGEKGVTKRAIAVVVWTEDTTDANLTLDYWVGYKSGLGESKTRTAQISAQVSESYWDIASWDAAYWDNSTPAYNPVVFNIDGAEGDCIKMKLSQSGANVSVGIAGFSVIYALGGIRK